MICLSDIFFWKYGKITESETEELVTDFELSGFLPKDFLNIGERVGVEVAEGASDYTNSFSEGFSVGSSKEVSLGKYPDLLQNKVLSDKVKTLISIIDDSDVTGSFYTSVGPVLPVLAGILDNVLSLQESELEGLHSLEEKSVVLVDRLVSFYNQERCTSFDNILLEAESSIDALNTYWDLKEGPQGLK